MTSKSLVFRRAAAFFAGLLLIGVTSSATDALLHATGVFAAEGQGMPSALWGLALAYRFAFGIASGALTARLAPDRPMAHAMALGLLGLTLGTVATIATWNAGPAFGPHWYPVLVALTAPLSTYCGAWLYTRGSTTPEQSALKA